jgi:ABC-type glutathione transport system ATPase component
MTSGGTRHTVTREVQPGGSMPRRWILAMLAMSSQRCEEDMARKSEELTKDAQTGPAAHSVALTKTYGAGQTVVHALASVDVTFARGRFTAVMGPSGSGKSTLMHCMAGLDRPTSGQTFVGNLEIANLDDNGLTQLRRDKIGFVFQYFKPGPDADRGREHHLARRPGRRQGRPGMVSVS